MTNRERKEYYLYLRQFDDNELLQLYREEKANGAKERVTIILEAVTLRGIRI